MNTYAIQGTAGGSVVSFSCPAIAMYSILGTLLLQQAHVGLKRFSCFAPVAVVAPVAVSPHLPHSVDGLQLPVEHAACRWG